MSDPQVFTFQAEIKQLLDILVHSLYTEREIFLRELISNASDALNRVQFEMLTNNEVLDADLPLEIRVDVDSEAGTITISDTGIGMTQEDMINNLGVIARSGAKAFIETMKMAQNGTSAENIIGQFGVGFYSVFMVADKVRVVSRSYKQDAEAYAWESTGGDTYSIEPSERATRGTDIIVHLKTDDREFASPWQVKEIIRRHSDYVAFPIFVDDDEEPTNKQTALWRQPTGDITDEQYDEFYKALTLDFDKPLKRIHMRADVPLQFYALMYIPASSEPSMFNLRKEPGLKLYVRKVLIQEYSRDLLPEYLGFVQGVVDSEDLPLNVTRESLQANRIMLNLRKTLTSKVISELKRMAASQRDDYLKFFREFGRFLKHGILMEANERADLEGLLFFNSTNADSPDEWVKLDEYVGRLAANQTDIYYILGDDVHSAKRSPHLDAFRQRGIEVLYFTDRADVVLLNALTEFKGHTLRAVDESGIDLNDIGTPREDETPQRDPLAEADFTTVRERFAQVLGGRVREVRESKTLVGSPARLVSDEDAAVRQMARINRLLERDTDVPVKILELNPRHGLLHNLAAMLTQADSGALVDMVVEQVFETAQLQDGIHPDPASMAARLTALMEAATARSEK
jgi:molecular chaperone HtpG